MNKQHNTTETQISASASYHRLKTIGRAFTAVMIALCILTSCGGDGVDWADRREQVEAIKADAKPYELPTNKQNIQVQTQEVTVPTTEVTATTVAKIDWKKCKSDLNNVQANMSTTDDALFDRLFQRAMRSCENEQTFRQYAPTQGIANMIEAGCALYPTQKLCQ